MKLLGGIGILGLVLLAYFLFQRDDIANYPPKNNTIVAFGDSLVFGYGATPGNDFVSLLSQKIDREIINMGRSGDTTSDGVLRMEEVLLEEPGIVILLLGGNDFLQKIPKEETRENLSTLIETFTESGAVVVLLGVRGGLLFDDSDSLFESLHEQYQTVYVEDVLKGVFQRRELMFDAIHPNDAGYRVIADRLYQVFQDYGL